MVLPDAGRTSVAWFANTKGHARRQIQFSARSFLCRTRTDRGLERADRELTRGKLRAALASVRSHDMGGMTVDYSNARRMSVHGLWTAGILRTNAAWSVNGMRAGWAFRLR